jgi:uncharacterized protein (UPF0332 family)
MTAYKVFVVVFRHSYTRCQHQGSMEHSFLARAKENLADAESAFEAGRYNTSANRAYYAAFHAAIEALRHFGYPVVVDYSRVQAAFSQYLINRRKVFPSRFKSYLSNLLDLRADADYKQEVSRKDASARLKNAQDIVSAILKVIEP